MHCSSSTQNKIKDQKKILENSALFLFSNPAWLQMVWNLKAEFLRRAITHGDRIRSLSPLEKRGHSDTLSHEVGGLENTASNARLHGQQDRKGRA